MVKAGSFGVVMGRMNASFYCDILDNTALLAFIQYYGEGSYVYQHDSMLCHAAVSVRNWFEDNNLENLQSPNLIPVKPLGCLGTESTDHNPPLNWHFL